jgi:hypothetical protein
VIFPETFNQGSVCRTYNPDSRKEKQDYDNNNGGDSAVHMNLILVKMVNNTLYANIQDVKKNDLLLPLIFRHFDNY